MAWSMRLILGGAVCAVCVPAARGQESADEPNTRVELRWVECRQVEGLTVADGFQSSCDPDSIVYPHIRPALVLTGDEVAEARLTELDLTGNGLGVLYNVTLILTPEAREALAASYEGNEMRMLTVLVDRKYWGVHRYEKDKSKPFVPEATLAERFNPGVGFFSSRSEAERLVAAFE